MRYVQLAVVSAVLCGFATIAAWGQEKAKRPSRPSLAGSTAETEKEKDEGWKSLLPETGLEGWKITDFGTDGKVARDGELLVIEMGDPLNGITYAKKDFPNDNFEIRLEAMRVEGNDFLCGLTFPVGETDQYCSLIAGGWGGSLVGLSSIDGQDASENATTTTEDFENGKWYKFQVRVDPELITVWINDKKLFDHERKEHKFSTRIEVWGSQPLGFCTFQSKVHVRNFEWRPVTEGKAEPGKPKEAPALGEVK